MIMDPYISQMAHQPINPIRSNESKLEIMIEWHKIVLYTFKWKLIEDSMNMQWQSIRKVLTFKGYVE